MGYLGRANRPYGSVFRRQYAVRRLGFRTRLRAYRQQHLHRSIARPTPLPTDPVGGWPGPNKLQALGQSFPVWQVRPQRRHPASSLHRRLRDPGRQWRAMTCRNEFASRWMLRSPRTPTSTTTKRKRRPATTAAAPIEQIGRFCPIGEITNGAVVVDDYAGDPDTLMRYGWRATSSIT